MYVIKKITVDDKVYQSSNIVGHTSNKKISNALILLDNVARNFVKDEFGQKAYDETKILDIHNIGQVCEPKLDCMLLYRLNDDPHRIHVYQRRSSIVKTSWVFGYNPSETAVSTFKRTHIFELEECPSIESVVILDAVPHFEMVPHGPAQIAIPKPMTVAPMCDVIKELKNCDKFKRHFERLSASMPNIYVPVIESSDEEIEEETAAIETQQAKVADIIKKCEARDADAF